MLNQIIAVTVGSACGSVLRFLVSTGFYQWLGRGFPYGTLAVNMISSFLLGLLVEAMILQRVAMTVEYRAAIMIRGAGVFVNFSGLYLIMYLTEDEHSLDLNVIGC